MKYTDEYTKEIAFPLGGIGTGSIGLDGTGRLIEWEIFNRPKKGYANGYSHIAVKAKNKSGVFTRVLNGDMDKSYLGRFHDGWDDAIHGTGMPASLMGGFPHFKEHTFAGDFPIASIDFRDAGFPAEVTLRAFNPFIPLDSENSSIPAAFFEIEFYNTSGEQTEYQAAFSVQNPFVKSLNQTDIKDGFRMVSLKNNISDITAPEYGDLTVATDAADTVYQSYWYRGTWKDHIVTFWNEFTAEDDLKERTYDTERTGEIKDVCTLAAKVSLKPGERRAVRFVLSWSIPNYKHYWAPDAEEQPRIWKNYYAGVFADSKDSASYALKNWDHLYEKTVLFKDSLANSTLDPVFKDAISSNLAVLKSPTVLRLEDGSFWGWEGVTDLSGSCEGTCQHVWNYAYALCFLFPDLERSVRNAEFKYGTFENGRTVFRLTLPYGSKPWDFRPCLDGQMGTVIKFYREWKLSGDDEWLRSNWEMVKKILEYAWHPENPDEWDKNKDGVLEGRQHHTLDMELYGPSSWLEGMYLAALKAAAEIAEYLGEDIKAREYTDIYNKGRAYIKEELFNGEYFIQKIDLKDKSAVDHFDDAGRYWNEEKNEIKYQVAGGSSIDQMLGQWHSGLLGLGEIFDKEQVKTALASMMKYNFKSSMRDFANPWRIFSVNDEAGTVMCEYPDKSTRPAIPISYCEETMTGFEYAFAGLLAQNGMTHEAKTAVKAVRDRYDGKKRNPWSEIECGNHYARSMASFALLPILSGFEFDLPKKHIGFDPKISGDLECPWFTGVAWGRFSAEKECVRLEVLHGEIKLASLGLYFVKEIKSLSIDGKNVDFTFDNGTLKFEGQSISKEIIATIN